ncbi:hypothetical protein FPSE_02143 [Fusarium pseudograminearum CS3096]|uniref:Uncharacterized protein n=1 Tax=Fusarium pseudograminearum (strain CS3096) TaxID=1028729 RepID=K3W2H2_FUSPC|nr:hypothetical protein FPSE_02143 [Fusarium pseudograminearum CS3096]EKJ77645.1 hypothetical protein FPSE_02143 [Fusarium pseudograminearum CS3096]KAF0636278.1 hypothetical protein FPSE5266_02143 [Fusarium pseudograminearum]
MADAPDISRDHPPPVNCAGRPNNNDRTIADLTIRTAMNTNHNEKTGDELYAENKQQKQEPRSQGTDVLSEIKDLESASEVIDSKSRQFIAKIKEIVLENEKAFENEEICLQIEELYLEIEKEFDSLDIRVKAVGRFLAETSFLVKEKCDDVSLLEKYLDSFKQLDEANDGVIGEQEKSQLYRLSQALASELADVKRLQQLLVGKPAERAKEHAEGDTNPVER